MRGICPHTWSLTMCIWETDSWWYVEVECRGVLGGCDVTDHSQMGLHQSYLHLHSHKVSQCN